MISSTSFLNRFRFCLLLAALALSGCAFPGGSARPEIRAVTGTPVRLTAEAAGPAEVAGQLFEFHLRRDGRDLGAAHTGSAPVWEWTPQEPGEYRFRTVVRDPAGKILVESGWSAPFEIAPPLEVQVPTTDRPAPQTAGTAVRWTAAATGGVGEITFTFDLRAGEEEWRAVQSGPNPEWRRSPAEAGRYQVRVVAVDAHGNRAESGWSAPYEIVPPLAVKSLAVGRPAPQTVGTAISWTAQASGGIGEISYGFELRAEGAATTSVQSNASPDWLWSPMQAGRYQVRAVAIDARGNRAESGWSDPYKVVPPLTVKTLEVGRPAPQTAGTSIPWTAQTSGGVGEISYGFELRPEGAAATTVQSGASPGWLWNPAQAGRYQVRSVAVDIRGNRAASDWSEPYEVVPPLAVKTSAADRPTPQTAGTAIRWSAQASGGIGDISYGFELRPEGGAAATIQSGQESEWLWSPLQAGRYQMRAVAVDARGNRAESEWSDIYEVVPPVAAKTPAADRPAPQAVGTTIRWKAAASGGVGEISYGFELRDDDDNTKTVQSGPGSEWLWSPAEAGRYQVRVVAVDSRGNRAVSDWGVPYEVMPPLMVKPPEANRPAPRAAGSSIRWTAAASGGVGEISFGFELRPEGAVAAAAHSGPSPEWIWNPVEAGRYQIRVVAVDIRGNRAESGWSTPYEIVPPLAVKTPTFDRPSPQAAGTAIRWMTQASGGVGEITYELRLRRGEGEIVTLQSGPASEWLWSPAEAGRYQVWVLAVDAHGNHALSDWSVPYEIVPPLAVKTPAADRPAPQMAGTAIRWTETASGGVGEISYSFELRPEGGTAASVQSGPSAEWLWSPAQAGRYQVRVVATDSRGNWSASDWSVPYEVVPPLKVERPATEQPAPQTAGTGIRWVARASGGVSEITYGFELRPEGGAAASVQSGPSAEWLWSPALAGRYQARVVATDIRGNRAESEWSAPYEVVPPLKVERLATDRLTPQTAGTAIRWTAQASGGVSEITYGFELRPEGGTAATVQSGPSAEWLWSPALAGRYQARVVATDIRGNRAASEWSAPYEVVPPLKVERLATDRLTPQTAGTAIRWTAQASGGVSEITYGFELRPEGGAAATVQSGPSAEWLWSPAEAGRYQARAVAVDTRGNRAESEWSALYEVVPPLAVKTPAADRPGPQTAGTAIRWRTQASGGVGKITYGFELRPEGGAAAPVQSDPSADWLWSPAEAGRYQARVVAVDARGNRAESEWSAPYEVVPPLKVTKESLIAVLPIENLSGAGGAPVRQLRQALQNRLAEEGFALLGDDRLDKFMTRHRIRHVGSMDTATARAFLEETGTTAVLITSLEIYHETDPPKIALFSRLVFTGGRPDIVWMDGVGMAGDDAPGILDLGLIHDPLVLRDKAVRFLVDSLVARLAGESARPGNGSGKFRPKLSFDASFLQKGKRYTIGVLPFINVGERKHAGEIMALHFVRQLAAIDDFIVLEPGVVREKLLNLRIVMSEGISKRDLDVISNSLEADLMLTGKVIEYQDLNTPRGAPKLEFSVLLMEREGKKIVWSSTSYNKGNDSVFFFDAGRVSTAFETATKMVRSLLAQMERSTATPGKEIPAGIDLLQQFRGLPQR